jgi:hypothetical protein
MKKYLFVLMAKGYRDKMTLLGQLIECPKMDAVYYSPIKHVYATDQADADYKASQLLNKKWIGFRSIPAKEN